MKKCIATLFAFVVLLSGLLYSGSAVAGGPDPCDPCAGVPWNTPVSTSQTFTMPHKPGCTYKLHLTYQTRPCLTGTQYELLTVMVEDLSGGNPACQLSCSDLDPIMNNIVKIMFSLIPGSIIRADPSSCFYTGKVTIPPAAAPCVGMNPGTVVTTIQPCYTTGCCISELTYVDPFHYYQNVIQQTPCPAGGPVIPPAGINLMWACDLGGGIYTFPVTFVPDTPIVCTNTCYTGLSAPYRTIKNPTVNTVSVEKGVFQNLKIFPNPVQNTLNVGFVYTAANETVTVELLDINGKVVAGEVQTTTVGEHTISINTAKLAPGSYACRISYPNNVITTRIVKE